MSATVAFNSAMLAVIVSGQCQRDTSKSLIYLMFMSRPCLARFMYTDKGMTPADRRLLRHLITAVVIKLVVLTALWWLFIRDARVAVDTDRIGQHLGGVVSSQGASK